MKEMLVIKRKKETAKQKMTEKLAIKVRKVIGR